VHSSVRKAIAQLSERAAAPNQRSRCRLAAIGVGLRSCDLVLASESLRRPSRVPAYSCSTTCPSNHATCMVIRASLFDARGATLPFKYRRRGDQMLTDARPTRVAVPAGGIAYVAINKTVCVLFSRGLATGIRLTPPGDEQALSVKVGRYPLLAYCGQGDPGNIIDLTPVEPTASAVAAPY
jgi:hypothetical protein